MKLSVNAVGILTLLALSSAAAAQTIEKKGLTLDGAKKVIAAAVANISVGKARTAVLFKRPTKFFEDAINKGRIAMTTLDDFTPLQGGIPLVVDGQVIGAVGVSGAASAQQDEELAIVGASALATTSAQAK